MSMITYKFDISASVDKTIINQFLPEHKLAMETLINLEAYPEKYDNDRFKTVYFSGFEIIDSNKISLDTKQSAGTSVTYQRARKGGGVSDKEEKSLDTSLVSKGSMLNVSPGAVYKRGTDDYVYITGMGRDGRYKKYNFTNRLVAVYKRKEGFTDDKVQNELSQLGNIFNPKELPQVEAKDYDIIEEGIRAIKNNWIDPKLYSGSMYNQILKRIAPQCEAVGIGKIKMTELAVVIENDSGNGKALPMTAEKAQVWIDGTDYKDIEDKVMYVIKSYDMVSKGQVDTVKLAKKHPSVEIRLIVHCGIITRGLEQYTSRLTTFWQSWDAQLDAYKDVEFGGKSVVPSNLTLYGGVPQMIKEFDQKKVCLYVQDSKKGEVTQELDGKLVTWK